MTLERQTFNHEIGGLDLQSLDPTNRQEIGRAIIERDLADARQKLRLARTALHDGMVSRDEYQSVADKLRAVEQQAIGAGYDPALFDDNIIDRGRHY